VNNKYLDENMQIYADLDKDAWYYTYVVSALVLNLLEENPNLEFFRPDEPALRGDVAEILYRVLRSKL